MSKILKNNTASPVSISDVGQVVPASGQLVIQPQDYWLYAASDNVITLISDLAVSPTVSTLTVNDGSFDLTINDGAKLIQGIFPNPVRIEYNKREFDTSAGATVGTTETSIVIPQGTLKYRIKAASPRTAKLTIADTALATSNILTSYDIPHGTVWEEHISGDLAVTIYIKSNKPNTEVQLLTWS